MYSISNMRKLADSKSSPCLPHHITDEVARALDLTLTQWFKENQRNLKFRQTSNPYAIMVSEFMLQQTTVAAVEPYYERFLRAYPTVQCLANAQETDIMAIWAGLGYYRRARQLHAAAKTITLEFDGTFPSDPAVLVNLPGFGRYTAGAVASQAFDCAAPIVEANTIRVFARLAGLDGVIGESPFMNRVWKVSERLVATASSPRDFNRAAMELGALICRPKPLCQLCPVQPQCAAHAGDFADRTPRPRPRKQVIPVETVTLAIEDSHRRYAVRKIPPGRWHAGLWEFPTLRTDSNGKQELPLFAANYADSLGISSRVPWKKILTLKYQVTHHKVVCTVFHCLATNSQAQRPPENSDISFLTLQEIFQLPLGSAQKKLLQFLENERVRSETHD